MKTNRKKALKIILITILGVASAAIILGVFVFIRGYFMYKSAFEKIPPAEMQQRLKSGEFANYSELPDFYINAVVCTEDRRFFSHGGTDIMAKGRAVFFDIISFSAAQGGSTITEQTAKNLWFTQEKTLERKAAEMFAAARLEKEFTKEEIFELYVNSIYFGSDNYGVTAAARGYFKKSPSELSRYECAVLTGLPNAPSVYSANSVLSQSRARQVLQNMAACGKISENEIDEIMVSGSG